MPAPRPATIGHHLIWTLYGHGLANDLRRSGSQKLHDEKFAPLGDVHHGRKPARQQPSRRELREFYRRANPLLNHAKLWLDNRTRQAVGDSFAEVVAQEGYTVWACAVLSNHAHMVFRRYRDDALTMWHKFAETAGLRLREEASLADNHPVRSSRSHKVFLQTPEDVRRSVAYVEQNPPKENLSPQRYSFVQEYNNWPFHKK